MYKWYAVWYHHLFGYCVLAFLSQNPQVHPLLVRKGGICNHFPHTCTYCYAHKCHVAHHFGGRYVIKIIIAESSPDTEPLMQQMFCFSSSILARGSKMPVMTASVVSDQGMISQFWHPHAENPDNTNARLMAVTPSLALDPTFGIHSRKTLDTAQPCHLLMPNWKPSFSRSIFIPTNIGTQFLLQSCVCVCVCVCVSVCVCVCSACLLVFPYNNLCKLFW